MGFFIYCWDCEMELGTLDDGPTHTQTKKLRMCAGVGNAVHE